jgi:mannan polymerase II complex MNN10 subunit
MADSDIRKLSSSPPPPYEMSWKRYGSSRLRFLSKQVILRVLCATIVLLALLQLVWNHQWQTVDDEPPRPLQVASPQWQAVHKVYCHGEPNCFPATRDFSLYNLQNQTDFCRRAEEGKKNKHMSARVATVTAHFGDAQRHYQRALGTHVLNNAVQRTGIYVLNRKLIDDLWNKPAFILDLLFDEMKKPEDERLEWLFWVDRDTIVLDPCRSPLSFLPVPAEGADGATDVTRNIHMLVTKDWNGLNNGIFLVRVSRWSIDLFTAILALRYYRPGTRLPFTEQTAMGILLSEPRFRDNAAWVPHWWFNAYARRKGNTGPVSDDWFPREYQARRGDYLVHFAGKGHRDEAMTPWLDVAENSMNGWAIEPKERHLDEEISAFWDDWRDKKYAESASGWLWG